MANYVAYYHFSRNTLKSFLNPTFYTHSTSSTFTFSLFLFFLYSILSYLAFDSTAFLPYTLSTERKCKSIIFNWRDLKLCTKSGKKFEFLSDVVFCNILNCLKYFTCGKAITFALIKGFTPLYVISITLIKRQLNQVSISFSFQIFVN